MRNLVKNERKMWYALFIEQTMGVDENGDFTGEPVQKFSAPVPFYAVLSPGRGYSGGAGTTSRNVYGVDVDAERRITSMDKSLPICETSLIYLHEPKVFEDGSADPDDAEYQVSARPADGISVVAFPIKSRLTINEN